MRITTKQIAAFVALADQQSFTRAARLLSVAQPSLSATIRDLEDVLGVTLFDRTSRGVSLSSAGTQFLPVAQRVHSDIGLMLSTSSGLTNLSQGRIRVACSNIIAATHIIPIACRFEERFPSIKVEIVDASEQSLADLVRSEEVDFAVATEVDPEPRIVQTRIAEDRMAVFMHASHRFLDQEEVAWAELANEPLALLHKNSPLRKLVDRTAGRLGIWLMVENEVSFRSTALALVEHRRMLTILPTNAVNTHTPSGCGVRRLVRPTVPRRVVILSLAGRSPSPASAQFQAECAEQFEICFD